MGKRRAAALETRRRIVHATCDLHSEQGIANTSWDEIAERAGVGVGTVYRHFPSLDELVPACGDLVLERLELPSPGKISAMFADTSDLASRLGRLVDVVFSIYERGASMMRPLYLEPDIHPRVQADRIAFHELLDALMDAALQEARPTERDRAVARAMLDLGYWDSLAAQNLKAQARREAVSDALARMLA